MKFIRCNNVKSTTADPKITYSGNELRSAAIPEGIYRCTTGVGTGRFVKLDGMPMLMVLFHSNTIRQAHPAPNKTFVKTNETLVLDITE